MGKYLMRLALVCLVICLFCSTNGKAGKEHTTGPKDFTLLSLDGEEITLSNLKGRVVIVDFWATWCPPCRNSIPALINLFNKYQGQGFTVLGISMEDRATLEKYRDQNNIPYPILLGNKEVAKAYNVQAIPHMFIIDKKGQVRKTQLGFAPELEAVFDALVDSLVREP